MLYYVPGISASSSSEFINVTHINIQLGTSSATPRTPGKGLLSLEMSARPPVPPPQAGTRFPVSFRSSTRQSSWSQIHTGSTKATASAPLSEALMGTHQSCPNATLRAKSQLVLHHIQQRCLSAWRACRGVHTGTRQKNGRTRLFGYVTLVLLHAGTNFLPTARPGSILITSKGADAGTKHP